MDSTASVSLTSSSSEESLSKISSVLFVPRLALGESGFRSLDWPCVSGVKFAGMDVISVVKLLAGLNGAGMNVGECAGDVEMVSGREIFDLILREREESIVTTDTAWRWRTNLRNPRCLG